MGIFSAIKDVVGGVAKGVFGIGGGGDDVNQIAYGLGSFGSDLFGSNQDRKNSAAADKTNMERQAKLSFENYEKQWNHKLGQGLTPWELTGTSTNNAPTPSNTLGNNPSLRNANLERQKQRFAQSENAKDRQNRLQLAAIQTQAPLKQADTSLKTYQLAAQIQPQKEKLIQAQIQQIKSLTQKTQFEFKNAWALKAATMSSENIMTALVMFNNGVDYETVLSAVNAATPAQKADIQKAYQELMVMRSHLKKEQLAVNEIIKVGVETGTNLLGEVKKRTKRWNWETGFARPKLKLAPEKFKFNSRKQMQK